ncbi:hypothetical protein ACIQAC_05535 [Streptomyces sp. NPDC088387]|uniref:hypothetical protein n=1 Tax=Streptomyces sp. NPDC088387 TaxID=3365859 RepID=UPI00380C4441
MRAIRVVASAAVLAAGALTFTAQTAQAVGDESRFRVSVSPETVAAGGRVTLLATGCDRSVHVSSGVFDDITIHRTQTTVSTTVDWDARPGAVYEVTFQCGTFWDNADLTIAAGHRPEPVRPVHPEHGVHAGEGGTLAGFDIKEIGLGLALITASVGAAYHFSRRRPEEDAG